MIKNYIKLAWRNLKKNRLFSVISPTKRRAAPHECFMVSKEVNPLMCMDDISIIYMITLSIFIAQLED